MLHVILHMAYAKSPLTSEQIAEMIDSNAVVVRRTLAGLREQGYVQSTKGHYGGWILNCALEDISLFDIYQAVGQGDLFTLHTETEHPDCLVEEVVNQSLQSILNEAENLIVQRLKNIKLSDLSKNFNAGAKLTHF